MSPSDSRALEAEPGDVHAAEAGALFTEAAKKLLPKAAYEELLQLASDDDVEGWSKRWQVDAPRFQEEALTIRALVALSGPEEFNQPEVHRWIGPPVPAEWLRELVRLNDLKILENFLEDGVPAIASESEIHQRAKALNLLPSVFMVAPRLYREYVERCQADPPSEPKVLAEIAARAEVRQELARQRQKWLDETLKLVRESRSEALKSDRLLAPIGADPVRESREHFEQRARVHWEARIAHATSLGYVPVTPKPSLQLHVQWLVRYQLRGETFAEIARSQPSVSSGTAVAKAVREIAALIALTLRPATRGRRLGARLAKRKPKKHRDLRKLR